MSNCALSANLSYLYAQKQETSLVKEKETCFLSYTHLKKYVTLFVFWVSVGFTCDEIPTDWFAVVHVNLKFQRISQFVFYSYKSGKCGSKF